MSEPQGNYEAAPNQYAQQQPSQLQPLQQQPSLPPPPPPSNVGWAVVAVLFFWPVSFSAFTHALNVYPRWAMGDFQGAFYASERAKKLGKIALWIFVIFFAVFILFYVILIAVLINSGDRFSAV